MNGDSTVGVLGAASLVGRPLLAQLVAAGRSVRAFSRRVLPSSAGDGVSWHAPGCTDVGCVPCWVALCPLWAVPDMVEWMASLGARRLVALSSTSLFTKPFSPDPAERLLARRLADAEEAVGKSAAVAGIRLCLLRPTMMYDGVHDRNVVAIARFVRRWRFFPVAGRAAGRRRPVHAADVAAAILAALDHGTSAAYTLSGGETLSYREMVCRIFAALRMPPRIIGVPTTMFHIALPAAHALGCCRDVTLGMAERMGEDMAFPHAEAARDLGFCPRGFDPAGVGGRDDGATHGHPAREIRG